MKIKRLVGSGEHIGLVILPFLVIGLALNFRFPAAFSVGGPTSGLRAASLVMLVPGVVVWIWSVVLILAKVPKGELITGGPYALVKHPLYTGVALLVLPWIGFLLNSWLGLVLGAALYIASRAFSREEEDALSQTFGPAWDEYRRHVAVPWV